MLKRFRVISSHAINGVVKGEEFEAEWPNDWLARRLNSSHIEEVLPAEDSQDEDPKEDFDAEVNVEESPEEKEEA